MPDVCDLSDDRIQMTIDAGVKAAQAKASSIPKGKPGVCVQCSDDVELLINGLCCACRRELGIAL